MSCFKLFLLLILSSSCLRLEAKVLGLYAWKTCQKDIVLLLPKISSSSAKNTAKTYLKNLKKLGPKAWGVLPKQPDWLCFIKNAEFEELSLHKDFKSIEMLIMANRIGHMSKGDPFPFVRQSLTRFGAKVHILPIRLDVVLSKEEFEQYYKHIINKYSALVAIGGADIDPRVLGQKKSVYTKSTFMEIDTQELLLMRRWFFEEKKAPLFGICRGHQLLGHMLGAKLSQDIIHEEPQASRHAVVSTQKLSKELDQATSIKSMWHPIRLTDQKNVLFEALSQSTVLVNSRHHQAFVNIKKQSFKHARVIAHSDDVVEAIELDSRRGFGVQFHPEDMSSIVGDAVMKKMVDLAIENRVDLENNER